jgi:hypothetical protein
MDLYCATEITFRLTSREAIVTDANGIDPQGSVAGRYVATDGVTHFVFLGEVLYIAQLAVDCNGGKPRFRLLRYYVCQSCFAELSRLIFSNCPLPVV